MFVSLIPNLNCLKGHDCIYHLAIKQVVEGAGWKHSALISKRCTVPSLPENWRPFFHAKNTSGFSLFRTLARFYDFSCAFCKKEKGRKIFFLESFNTTDLAAFALASLFFLRKKETLWVLFRLDSRHLPYKGKIHTFLVNLLRFKHFIALTDSELVQKDFSENLGIDLHLVPIPHTEILPKKVPGGTIQCWWPGDPRESKGLKEIQCLLSTTDPAAFRFTLLFSEKMEKKGVETTPFRTVSDALSREKYAQALSESSVILLPYDPLIYNARTSGIFVEAITAGKVPLVKEGSWLAHELKKHELEELIVDWEETTFFSHVYALLEREEVYVKLERMREKYLRVHSCGGFFEAIRELL